MLLSGPKTPGKHKWFGHSVLHDRRSARPSQKCQVVEAKETISTLTNAEG